MKTLYIDVYFLINFTVDILALHFAAIFSKISVSVPRLLISAFVGATYALAGILLIENSIVMFFVSILSFALIVFIAAKGVGMFRKSKYALAFFTFQIIIGGLVYFSYCMLDKFMNTEDFVDTGVENRKLLILSLLVLLSIGIIKLIISAFGTVNSEKNIKLLILYNGHEHHADALVDSGNLALDPLDKTPVMLINGTLSKKIFGFSNISIDKSECADYEIKKRIRIIPVNYGGERKIFYAIKPDGIYALIGKRCEKLSLIIAIDGEGDNYGGYPALMPLSALDGVFYGSNKFF